MKINYTIYNVSSWPLIFNVFTLIFNWNRAYKFNSRIISVRFSSQATRNKHEMIAGTQSYIFRWRSFFRRCRLELSSQINVECFKSHSSKDARRNRAAVKVLKEGYLFKERPPPPLPPGTYIDIFPFVVWLATEMSTSLTYCCMQN